VSKQYPKDAHPGAVSNGVFHGTPVLGCGMPRVCLAASAPANCSAMLHCDHTPKAIHVQQHMRCMMVILFYSILVILGHAQRE
jgi:hypothetical protein